MKLLTFRWAGGPPCPGAYLAGGHVVDLRALGRELRTELRNVTDLLAQEGTLFRRLSGRLDALATDPGPGVAAGWIYPYDSVALLPPTGTRPFLLSCGGLYHSHLQEMGVTSAPPRRPDAYVVNPNTLIGSREPIVLPPAAPAQVDWEGELCVVLGRPTHRVGVAAAMDHVAGFTIFNDVSARDHVPDWVLAADPEGAVRGYVGNALYKNWPTFGPIGPWIVTRDELPDVGSARLTTMVNGALMQDDLVGNLRMSIAEVIAAATEVHAFDTGDMLTFGTPAGVGYARNPRVFLVPGDVVEVSVAGIGTLTNTVQAAAQSTAHAAA